MGKEIGNSLVRIVEIDKMMKDGKEIEKDREIITTKIGIGFWPGDVKEELEILRTI
jgi:hypothetical protein